MDKNKFIEKIENNIASYKEELDKTIDAPLTSNNVGCVCCKLSFLQKTIEDEEQFLSRLKHLQSKLENKTPNFYDLRREHPIKDFTKI